MASACLELMELDKTIFNTHNAPMLSHINIGTGEEVAINQLAQLICQCVGYEGNLKFDSSIPDGTPRKTLESSRLKAFSFKWTPVGLQAGLELAYKDFLGTPYAQSTSIIEPSKQDQHRTR
jgi:GDP-L-fucose synthase